METRNERNSRIARRIHDNAALLWKSGLKVIPLGEDKMPLIAWKQTVIRWGDCAAEFFKRPCGIGALTGERSGNLEVLDFDLRPEEGAKAWLRSPGVLDIARRLAAVETPSGGYHFYYRCSVVEGNQKFAMGYDDDGKPKAIVESRGEGGMIVLPGGWVWTHPTGKPYRLRSGSLLKIPMITPEQRETLISAACKLNQIEQQQREVPHTPREEGLGLRPGDDFNRRATWEEILGPAGWMSAGGNCWTRPGKLRGVSAIADETFCNFSSSVLEFEPEQQYSRFAVYAILHHDGNFKAAAAALAEKGYGWRFATHYQNEESLKDR